MTGARFRLKRTEPVELMEIDLEFGLGVRR
jgi:hypothetical protein